MNGTLFSPRKAPCGGILACYMRVSLEDSHPGPDGGPVQESSSIDAQRRLLYDFAASREDLRRMEIREFSDDGYSGTHFDRPAIQELFRLAAQGKIGCIMVKDISRFGRNYIETGRCIEQIFPSLGIRFIAVNDCFDSMTQAGNAFGIETAFKNIIYDYYSRDLSEKVKSIKKIQQQRGDFVAAKPPYGYVISARDRHRLEVDPESAQVVKTVFALTLSGQKPGEIARHLNRLSVPTPAQRLYALYGFRCGLTESALASQFWKPGQITKILQDETLTGASVNHRVQVKAPGSRKLRRLKPEEFIVVRDTHEAVIDRDTFLQAAAIVRSRRTASACCRKKNQNLFYGKIFCGHCGVRLKHEVHTRGSRTDAVYYCPRARPSGGGTCGLAPVRDRFLAELVLRPLQVRVLLTLDTPPQTAFSETEALPARLQTVLRLLEQNRNKVSRLYWEYREGRIAREQFIRQKDAVGDTIRRLTQEKAEAEKRSPSQASLREPPAPPDLQESMGLKTLNQSAVDLFIDKVILTPGKSPDFLYFAEIIWKSKG